ncbi:MAG: helix-turn-helix domain-containing protein [Erysipelotrichaceae bacterium]|nr:helix-turn-helix domain-containing protein [Erysipelotrichaceae bacterium]
MSTNKAFGKRIRKLRKDNNLTLEEMSKIAGLSSSAVSNWEQNNAVPNVDTLLKISRYFGKSVDYMLGNEYYANNDMQAIFRGLNNMNDKESQKTLVLLNAVFDDIAF